MTEIVAPFQQFFGADGVPLANGMVYIGAANLDAESNPISVFWDDALTIPAAQPIRTLNGYPINNGSPARLYIAQTSFSLTVRNAQGRLIFSVQSISALLPTGSIPVSATAPGSPTTGMLWLDNDTPSATIWTLKQYDGADWIELGRLDTTNNIYIPSEGVIAWADVPSASTVDLGAQASRHLRITGTTAISSFGTISSGTRKELRFAGALTLTHNATSLILPSGANITTAAGDTATAISLGSGNWVVVDYQRASGQALVNPAVLPGAITGSGLTMTTARLLGRVTAATGAIEELTVGTGLTLSAGDLSVSFPIRAWVNFNGTGTVAIRASGGVTSITDNGTGDYTVNFNFTMPDANYCVVGVGASSAPDMLPLGIKGDVPPTTTNVRVWVKSVNVAAGAFDPLYASIAIIR